MTIRNEYKQLKKENDIIFSTLAECDRDTITGIVNTINNTRGINYEVELVRKDLIAMAAGAEADGQYLPAVIGDVDAFKRGLLASMPQPKLVDYMLDSLIWLCLFGLAQAAVLVVWFVLFSLLYRWVYPALPNVGIPNIIATALFAVITLVLRGWRTRRYNQLADARPWRDVVDTKKQ